MASSQEGNSGLVSNWQAGKTLAQCNLHMLEEQESCDITFLCGEEGSVIKAHRYMLISRSYVFNTMFSGPLTEQSDILVPDIELEVFKQLLIYLYTDDVTIDAENVMALLYTATKYGVTALESICQEFLRNNLSVENACPILEASQRYNQEDLFNQTLTLIKDYGDMALQTGGFLDLSQSLVDEIIGADDLVADEQAVFDAVNHWAEEECGRLGREVTADSKRSVLGDSLYKIRFPLMEAKYVAENVKGSGLLSRDERLTVQDYIASPGEDVGPFNAKHRSQLLLQAQSWIVCQRLQPANHFFTTYDGELHAITFKCNIRLSVCGFQLYGSDGQAPNCREYKVTTYFGQDCDANLDIIQEQTSYNVNTKVFDVLFPRPVKMEIDTWYTLGMRMVGPGTWCVGAGKDVVRCEDGVVFKFRNSRWCETDTCVKDGQIPAIFYNV